MRGKSDKKGTTGVGGSFAVHLGLRPFGLNLECSTPDIVPGAVGGGDISQAALPVQASAGGGGKAENRPPPAHTEPLAAPLEAVPKKASAPMQLSGMCSA